MQVKRIVKLGFFVNRKNMLEKAVPHIISGTERDRDRKRTVLENNMNWYP
jgi:hypothetical protein